MQVVDDQLVFQDQLSKKWLAVPLVKLISEIDDDNKLEGIINEKYMEQNS